MEKEEQALEKIREAIELCEGTKYENFLVLHRVLCGILGLMFADKHEDMLDVFILVSEKARYVAKELAVQLGKD